MTWSLDGPVILFVAVVICIWNVSKLSPHPSCSVQSVWRDWVCWSIQRRRVLVLVFVNDNHLWPLGPSIWSIFFGAVLVFMLWWGSCFRSVRNSLEGLIDTFEFSTYNVDNSLESSPGCGRFSNLMLSHLSWKCEEPSWTKFIIRVEAICLILIEEAAPKCRFCRRLEQNWSFPAISSWFYILWAIRPKETITRI